MFFLLPYFIIFLFISFYNTSKTINISILIQISHLKQEQKYNVNLYTIEVNTISLLHIFAYLYGLLSMMDYYIINENVMIKGYYSFYEDNFTDFSGD